MLQIPKLKAYITDADDMRGDALQQTTWEDMIIHVCCLQTMASTKIHYPYTHLIFPDRFANLYPNLGFFLGYCSCCQSLLMLFAIKSGPYLWAMLLPSITISMWEITSIQPCCTGRYFIQIAGDFELCGSFVSCPWNTLCLPICVVYPVLLWMFARMLSSFGANA